MKQAFLLVAACSTFGVTCALSAAEAETTAIDPAELVAARQGGMTMSVMTLTAVSRVAEGEGSVKGGAFAASGLASFAKSLPTLFSAETQAVEGTEALPAIWANSEAFAAQVAEYQSATEALQAAAIADDREAFTAAAARTKNACSSCHASYRAE